MVIWKWKGVSYNLSVDLMLYDPATVISFMLLSVVMSECLSDLVVV